MSIAQSVAELIGHTPLVRLNKLSAGLSATVVAKLESRNPGGSIKDRIGASMLVSGFGKFEAYDKNSRRGRNPQTNESITLPPRKVVVFRLSRKFRAELNPLE